MPRRLPLRDVIGGLLASVATAVKYWLHYTLVAIAWLGIVPLTACRIYRCLFTGSLDSILTLPIDMLSTENIASDIFHGCFVVTCTLFAFIGLVWLREQILHGGGPEWLERDIPPAGNGEAGAPMGPAPVVPENNNVPVAGLDEMIPDGQAQVNDDDPMEDPPPNAAGDANGAAADENNWIPVEWDRAEELTWERLLGLDGSLVFLEHVFWVVSLNTLFILIFAFSPYHIGQLTVAGCGFREYAMASHFEGLVTTLCGYCVIGIGLVVLHNAATLLGLRKPRRVLGLCYVVVKVSLLSVVEIGVLPLVCGWWLDVCSLAMFDATLKDREASFRLAPGTSMFIHWLVGMVYVYYFASFILLLREVLRPGVLWFLRNLNDPDFSPIQEMIHLPILDHIRRLVASACIFGTAVLLMLWLPVRVLRAIWPQFLPYTVALHSEAHVNELSLELLLLQVILPALLEQSHTRAWLKAAVRTWCRGTAKIIGLRSYLLGADVVDPSVGNGGNGNGAGMDLAQPPLAAGLGAAHQALLHREGPTGFEPYERPAWFPARLFVLVCSAALSLVAASLIALTVPVWLGRRVMGAWLAQPPPQRVHELYTASAGTYVCWVGARAMTLVLGWLPQGRRAITTRLKQWAVLGAKTLVASIALLGVIPLLFGLLLELVVVVPLRVPLEQTPVLFVWQDWALGVLYTKIACAVTMMGPDWRLRAAIERAYRDGIRDMDLGFVLRELAAPVVACFGLALAVPYVVAHSLVPLAVASPQLRNLIARRLYPFLLLVCFLGALATFQVRQFQKLYEHIKNDKYLVGQRLVNYDHRRQKAASAQPPSPVSAPHN